ETVRALAQVAREAIIAHDDILLLNYIKLIGRSRTCAEAFVLDAGGKILIHTDPSQIGAQPDNEVTKRSAESAIPLRLPARAKDGSEVIDVSSPIMLGSQRLGT